MRGRFTLEFWQDGAWYVGRLIEVPGVFSQGETLEELRENIQDAYDLLMEAVRNGLSDESRRPELTEDLKNRLDLRLEALDKNPDAVIAWEVVEARALERFGK